MCEKSKKTVYEMWRYIKKCSGWASFLQNYVAQISNRYHVTRSVSQEFSIISRLRSRVVQYINFDIRRHSCLKFRCKITHFLLIMQPLTFVFSENFLIVIWMIMQAHKEVDLSYIYIMPYPDKRWLLNGAVFSGKGLYLELL